MFNLFQSKTIGSNRGGKGVEYGCLFCFLSAGFNRSYNCQVQSIDSDCWLRESTTCFHLPLVDGQLPRGVRHFRATYEVRARQLPSALLGSLDLSDSVKQKQPVTVLWLEGVI